MHGTARVRRGTGNVRSPTSCLNTKPYTEEDGPMADETVGRNRPASAAAVSSRVERRKRVGGDGSDAEAAAPRPTSAASEVEAEDEASAGDQGLNLKVLKAKKIS